MPHRGSPAFSTPRWSAARARSACSATHLAEPAASGDATCSRCSARRASASPDWSRSSSPSRAGRSGVRRALSSLRRWDHLLAGCGNLGRPPGCRMPTTAPRRGAARKPRRRRAGGGRAGGSARERDGLGGVPAAAEEINWAIRRAFEHLGRHRPAIRLRGHQLGGAGAARPDRLPGRMVPVERHSARLHRPSAAARPASIVGGGKTDATTILVEPLQDDECDRLISRLVPGGRMSASQRSRVIEAADGNPLFVEQLLAMTGRGEADVVEVPPTITALLAARLEQLTDAERGVLESASVEGRIFHRSAVDALLPPAEGLPSSQLLQGLTRREFIEPNAAQFPSEEAYRFQHVLIRDAAYNSIPKRVRADHHERFSGWLESLAGDRIEEYEEILAHHLAEAVRYRRELARGDRHADMLAERAAESYRRAADRAAIAATTWPPRRCLGGLQSFCPSPTGGSPSRSSIAPTGCAGPSRSRRLPPPRPRSDRHMRAARRPSASSRLRPLRPSQPRPRHRHTGPLRRGQGRGGTPGRGRPDGGCTAVVDRRPPCGDVSASRLGRRRGGGAQPGAHRDCRRRVAPGRCNRPAHSGHHSRSRRDRRPAGSRRAPGGRHRRPAPGHVPR